MCADGKYRPTPGIEPGQLTHSVDYPIAGVCVYQLRHIDPVIPMLEPIFILHTHTFSQSYYLDIFTCHDLTGSLL